MAERSVRDRLKREMTRAVQRRECYRPASNAERIQLVRMVKEEIVLRPVRNGYVLPEDWKALNPVERHICKVHTIGAMHPDWVFCGVSAAAIWGFSVPWSELGKVEVVAGTNRRKDTHDVKFRRPTWLTDCCAADKEEDQGKLRSKGYLRAVASSEDVCFHYRVNVTSKSRTLFECLRRFSEADGLAVADSATHISKWVDDHVLNSVERLKSDGRRYRNVRKAELVSSYVDGRSESGGESILRMNVLLAGFELPELQVEVHGPANLGCDYRVDQMWLGDDGVPVIGELDGFEKRVNVRMTKGKSIERVLCEERMRESRLSAIGARIMRVSFEIAEKVEELAGLLESFGVPRRRGALRPRPRSKFVRRGNVRYFGDGEHRIEGRYDRVTEEGARRSRRRGAPQFVVSRDHSWYGDLVNKQLEALYGAAAGYEGAAGCGVANVAGGSVAE